MIPADGDASNVVISANQLGIRTPIFTSVGNNHYAKQILSHYKKGSPPTIILFWAINARRAILRRTKWTIEKICAARTFEKRTETVSAESHLFLIGKYHESIGVTFFRRVPRSLARD